MQQRLALLAAHVLVVVAEHEAHGGEEVALARAIAPDDDVALGREGLDLGLVLVALEALDGDLLDVAHGGERRGACVWSGQSRARGEDRYGAMQLAVRAWRVNGAVLVVICFSGDATTRFATVLVSNTGAEQRVSFAVGSSMSHFLLTLKFRAPLLPR